MSGVLKDLYREFPVKARIAAPLVGRYLAFKLRREERRLHDGWTYEPPTFREANQLASAKV